MPSREDRLVEAACGVPPHGHQEDARQGSAGMVQVVHALGQAGFGGTPEQQGEGPVVLPGGAGVAGARVASLAGAGRVAVVADRLTEMVEQRLSALTDGNEA